MRNKPWIPTLLVVGIIGLSGGPAMAEDELFTQILKSHPGLQDVVIQPSDFRLIGGWRLDSP